MRPEALQGISRTLTNQQIRIPSLELKRYIFDQRANERGLVCNRIIPINNATNILMMFPRSNYDCTVFQNIMYKNCQLTVHKTAYPYYPFENTWDGRFTTLQLMSYELDNTQASPELVESLSRPLNDISKYDPRDEYERFLSCPFDNTNFGINFQFDRGNCGFNFDGIDTSNNQVVVEFKGEPYCSGEYDTYLNPLTDKKGDVLVQQPPVPFPEMWVFSYHYWTLSSEGIKYETSFPDWYYGEIDTGEF